MRAAKAAALERQREAHEEPTPRRGRGPPKPSPKAIAEDPSLTYARLVGEIGRGETSINRACVTAADTNDDIRERGGRPSRDLEGLASCPGSQCERNLHRWMRKLRRQMGFVIEPFQVPLTLKDVHGKGASTFDVPAIIPHEVLHAFHCQGEEVFARSFLGESEERVQRYWDHMRDQEWVQEHPAMRDPSQWRHAIPSMLHEDDVQCRNISSGELGKVCIIQWGSILCRRITS